MKSLATMFSSAACLSLSLMLACSPEAASVSSSPDAQQARGLDTNPQEGVGIAHNDLLACLGTFEPSTPKVLLQREVESCGFKMEGELDELVDTYAPHVPVEDGTVREHVERSTLARAFDEQHYGIIDAIDEILAEGTDTERTLAQLEALEAEALQDLGSTTADQAVLAGLATARYSVEFWSTDTRAAHPTVEAADIAGAKLGYQLGGFEGAVYLGTAASDYVRNR